MSLLDEINNQMNINAQKEREVRRKEDLKRHLDPKGIMHTSYNDETFKNTAFVNKETPNGIGNLIIEAMGILRRSSFKSDIQYSSEGIKEDTVSATYVWSCHFQTDENGKRCMVEDFRHYSVFYRYFKGSMFNPAYKQAINYLDSYMRKYCEYLLESKYSNKFVSGGGLYLFDDGYCFDASRYEGCVRSLTSGYGNAAVHYDRFKKSLAALVIANR